MTDEEMFILNFYVAQPLAVLLVLVLLPRRLGLALSALALAGALVFWFVNAMDPPSGPYIDMGSGLLAIWAAALAGAAAGGLVFQAVRTRVVRVWQRLLIAVVCAVAVASGIFTVTQYMPALAR